MNSSRIAAALDDMALHPGIQGCALVDASTGLVWNSSAGVGSAESIWEAAVDYWRLHDRQKRHFAGLGALGAVAMYHTRGVLAVFPCCNEPNVLLVCHGLHQKVDWISWQRMVRDLGVLISSKY